MLALSFKMENEIPKKKKVAHMFCRVRVDEISTFTWFASNSWFQLWEIAASSALGSNKWPCPHHGGLRAV